MDVKIYKAFKRVAIFVLALLGFLVSVNWTVRAETVKPADTVWKRSDSYIIIIAQTETQTTANDKRAPASKNKESESKTDETKEPREVKKNPLKDFKPSERIEAEQAVDFPYDI
jgi:hypothetical protein